MPHASDLSLTVLHGLRLKGFTEAAGVAELLGRDEAEVAAQLEEAARLGLALRRDGRLSGWTLTPDGRVEGERLLAGELDAAGVRDEVRQAYERFLALNGDMLGTCTRWQVRDGEGGQVLNDHTDPAYDAQVIADLASIDERVQPICARLAGELDRFAHYGPRFSAALERIQAGQHEWFTKPVVESYHTVWFELHEDLLATLGLDRATEAAH